MEPPKPKISRNVIHVSKMKMSDIYELFDLQNHNASIYIDSDSSKIAILSIQNQ